MNEFSDDKKFEQIAHLVEPHTKLLRVWELKGGISAQVTALEVERPDGQTHKMVVRQHEVLNQKSHELAQEYKLLEILHPLGLATPKPYYLDQSGEILSTPYIVIEFIEGQTDFTPNDLPDFLRQLASQLCRIHAVDSVTQDFSFLPEQEQFFAARFKQRPAILDDSLNERRIRDTLEAVWPLPQRNRTVLLHGDYWPGNVLWQDGQLKAVVDWEDAQLGDPLTDVAITRLDILWTCGIEAMQRFTHDYQSMTSIDFTNLPYWDLYAALRPAGSIARWAGDAAQEKIMRDGHHQFITQAFEKLAP